MKVLQTLIEGKTYLAAVCVMFFFTCFIASSVAQGPEKPPRPIEISPMQNLNFGGIIVPTGATGTVSLSPNNVRSFVGSLYPFPGIATSAARFQIKAHPGTSLSVSVSDVTMDNGSGGTIELKFEGAYISPAASFVSSTAFTDIFVGGTLYIGAASTVGEYTKSFQVTVNQE